MQITYSNYGTLLGIKPSLRVGNVIAPFPKIKAYA